MTTTIVDELMGLVASVTDASGLDFSAYVAARSKLESRLRELLTGEPVAWRAVAQPSIHDFLNSDERDVVYFDAREVPTGEDAKGFTITPLYRSPRPFDAGAISDERIDAALAAWHRFRIQNNSSPDIAMRSAISAALVQPCARPVIMNRARAEEIARKHANQMWRGDAPIPAEWVKNAIMEAVAEEREACAKLADEISFGPYELSGGEIGEAIRSRNEQPAAAKDSQ